jgi:hypothetical protein
MRLFRTDEGDLCIVMDKKEAASLQSAICYARPSGDSRVDINGEVATVYVTGNPSEPGQPHKPVDVSF